MRRNKPEDDVFARPSSSSIGCARRRSNPLLCLFFFALYFLPCQAAATAQDGIYKAALPPKPAAAELQAVLSKPEESEAERFSYDPTGKPDPFKSFILEQEEMAEKAKKKPRTYLETLDLSQLELIAIVIGPQGSYAMVRDSKGVGHVIIKGTAVGTNGGVVDRITDREVVIREEYRDFRGSTQFKDVSKKLPSLM